MSRNQNGNRVTIIFDLKETKENTKEITLLFLAINVKTEGLENQIEDGTIMKVKLYIVKKKGE